MSEQMSPAEAREQLKAYLSRQGDAGYDVLVENLRRLKAFEADASSLTILRRGGYEPIAYAEINNSDSFRPTIDKVYQRSGEALWAIRCARSCLNKLGEWEYESLPSSRDDDFIERCRYTTLEDAVAALNRARASESPADERARRGRA